jgi:hypothetical protein
LPRGAGATAAPAGVLEDARDGANEGDNGGAGATGSGLIACVASVPPAARHNAPSSRTLRNSMTSPYLLLTTSRFRMHFANPIHFSLIRTLYSNWRICQQMEIEYVC